MHWTQKTHRKARKEKGKAKKDPAALLRNLWKVPKPEFALIFKNTASASGTIVLMRTCRRHRSLGQKSRATSFLVANVRKVTNASLNTW